MAAVLVWGCLLLAQAAVLIAFAGKARGLRRTLRRTRAAVGIHAESSAHAAEESRRSATAATVAAITAESAALFPEPEVRAMPFGAVSRPRLYDPEAE